MKSIVIAIILLFAVSGIQAQKKYEANWASIDSRETPQWWKDAKFGIFIHWGPYSVPAFSQLGEYSEWYWHELANTSRKSHTAVKAFHDKNYGEKFTYPDFVPKFTCEFFDPQKWASIFEQAGAKYVVLTSKHHDGYCLWPNEEANKSWGRPWNSTNTGSGRDLLGELTEAVRKTNVKMGIYYSLYEWYNPLYTSNPDLFVEKHLIPQFKDVVKKYSPAIIFSDGEWEHSDSTWRSTEMLSWLFNESPCKDEVVINDRWGKTSRHKHGGYYTTEYGSGMPNATHPWEENRGMAYSFGYSRTENLADYHTSQEFIYMLIDIVSRGGNFLLDIGPAADGTIPVIMQDRLAGIGDWLKVNGEAIYGTTTWENTCQWTKGKVKEAERGRYKIPYDIMKLTVNPDAGYASKEIFFTHKNNVLYGICPVYPDGKLVVKNISATANARISMLGVGKDLKWKQVGSDIEIEIPRANPSSMPCKYAYTYKIEGIQ